MVPTGSEAGGSTSLQTGSNLDGRPETNVLPAGDAVEVESDSSTSSSSSDDVPDDEVAEKFHWKEHCEMYKHVRTHKLHLQPVGSETGTFLCGRTISEDYKKFSGTIACDSWKCKQCDSCRPLHDVGSMVAYLDRAEARRASDRAPR